MNKKIVSYIVIPVLGLAILGGSVALAASNTKGSVMTNIVAAISQKFNLNSTDVQAVVDQTMANQKASMQADQTKKFTDRINQAVTDKKLTQDQADKIIAKRTELQAANLALKDKTPAERQAAMKTQMTALKQWATDNNIPQGYLMFGGPRMGGGRGFGHGNKSGTTNSQAPSSTTK
jgi:hypothetical protein